jgi:2-phosphosulfolactate phosphatase
MKSTVFVHLLPALIDPTELTDATVVVIDVLRATSTITTALAAGAAGIIPFAEVAAARQRAAGFPGSVLLGGERQGKRINGFDLGNSPGEYTPDVVRDQTILFTTTNGTRALATCQQASRVLLAGFVNLAAVVTQVDSTAELHILCAGTNETISQEDMLLAGALTEALGSRSEPFTPGNDSARLAQQAWCSSDTEAGQLKHLLQAGRGGQNLLQLGLEADIAFCATLDRFDVVPSLDPETGTITRA